MTDKMVAMPNMWLAYNEKLNLFIRRNFKMIDCYKENRASKFDRTVVRIEDGKAYSETFVQITSIDDRGDYWYIGYKPVGMHAGTCGFGYTRYYKDFTPEYGTLAFEDATNININTGKAK
jgi:hypothetical protein